MAYPAVHGGSGFASRHVSTQLPMFVPGSDWQRPAELPDLRRAKTVAIDLETRDGSLAADMGPGWAYASGYVAGVSAAWEGGCAYVPVCHPDTECFDRSAVGAWLRDLLVAGPRVVTHHGSYDWGWMLTEWPDLRFPERIEDTLAMSVMIDENRLSYKLKDLCAWRGIEGKDETLLRESAAAYGIPKDKVKENLWQLPARFVGPYAEQDARATLALADSLQPELDAQCLNEAYRLEMELVPIVDRMRRRGIRVDLEHARQAEKTLTEKRDQAVGELSDLIGRRLSIADLRRASILANLHDQFQIGYPRTAKTGQGSFTDSWMQHHDHWLPRLVSRATRMDAAASKFIKGFVRDFAHKGRIHASVNQFRSEDGGTRSHRFSYADPPLQQSPARDDEIASLFRGCFLPEEGSLWLAADYSQQEYRLIVHFAELLNQPRAAAAAQMYRDNVDTDFHQLVIDWTGLDRKRAKNTNFAKAYGAGVKKFAAMIEQSVEDAAEIYGRYDEELPFVKGLSLYCMKLAERRGFVKLTDGARCHFDLWEPASWDDRGTIYGARPLPLAREAWPGKRLRRAGCHKAMNRLIQGSAARQAKLAIAMCERAGHVPMLQMHDELDFSVSSERDGIEIGEIMREAAAMSIPSKVDMEYGVSWGDAKHAWEEVAR